MRKQKVILNVKWINDFWGEQIPYTWNLEIAHKNGSHEICSDREINLVEIDRIINHLLMCVRLGYGTKLSFTGGPAIKGGHLTPEATYDLLMQMAQIFGTSLGTVARVSIGNTYEKKRGKLCCITLSSKNKKTEYILVRIPTYRMPFVYRRYGRGNTKVISAEQALECYEDCYGPVYDREFYHYPLDLKRKSGVVVYWEQRMEMLLSKIALAEIKNLAKAIEEKEAWPSEDMSVHHENTWENVKEKFSYWSEDDQKEMERLYEKCFFWAVIRHPDLKRILCPPDGWSIDDFKV